MTQEALKLALDALEDFSHKECCDNGEGEIGSRVCCEVLSYKAHDENCKVIKAITAIKEALAQTQEPVAVYGYCPECGAKGVMRERRPNGNDKCANGHTYPSSKSTPPQPEQEPVVRVICKSEGFAGPPRRFEAQPEQEPVADDFFRMIADSNPKPFSSPQRTWVDLTDEQIDAIYTGVRAVHREIDSDVFARAIESKLKQKNGFAEEKNT